MARRPSVPSEAVPERTTPIAWLPRRRPATGGRNRWAGAAAGRRPSSGPASGRRAESRSRIEGGSTYTWFGSTGVPSSGWTTAMAVAFASASRRKLTCVRVEVLNEDERHSAVGGEVLEQLRKASSPPAEAPTPTTGTKGSRPVIGCQRPVDGRAHATTRGDLRFRLFRASTGALHDSSFSRYAAVNPPTRNRPAESAGRHIGPCSPHHRADRTRATSAYCHGSAGAILVGTAAPASRGLPCAPRNRDAAAGFAGTRGTISRFAAASSHRGMAARSAPSCYDRSTSGEGVESSSPGSMTIPTAVPAPRSSRPRRVQPGLRGRDRGLAAAQPAAAY